MNLKFTIFKIFQNPKIYIVYIYYRVYIDCIEYMYYIEFIYYMDIKLGLLIIKSTYLPIGRLEN